MCRARIHSLDILEQKWREIKNLTLQYIRSQVDGHISSEATQQ